MTADPKPRKRHKADKRGWALLREAKGGACRVCGDHRYELHHLVGRDLGGPDVNDNLVPLCSEHHRLVEERRIMVWRFLTPAEQEFVIEQKGPLFANRYYGARVAA